MDARNETMPAFIDLTNRTFGKLVVITKAASRNRRVYWNCVCKCGRPHIVGAAALKGARPTRSCGCLKRETANRGRSNASFVHGMTGTSEYAAYRSARTRCHNPNAHGYMEYGGRGIEFKFSSFEEFFTELGARPSPTHSVDRIENDGNYEPGNVRWATKREQLQNRRKFGMLSKFSIAELTMEFNKRIPEYGLCGC